MNIDIYMHTNIHTFVKTYASFYTLKYVYMAVCMRAIQQYDTKCVMVLNVGLHPRETQSSCVWKTVCMRVCVCVCVCMFCAQIYLSMFLKKKSMFYYKKKSL